MKAVIMAGGKGTRLLSITKDEIPKPMAPLNNKPILEWQIENLKQNNITEIILIIGHLGNRIREYFKDGSAFGVSIQYIEEKEPLGTAGAFYYLKEKMDEEYFLLVFGDVLFDINIGKMEQFHVEHKSIATLFVHPNSHPFDSDLVLRDSDSRIMGFDSKNNVRNYYYDNCVNAGFYIINKKVCDQIEKPQKVDLEKDVLMKLVSSGQNLYAYSSPEYIKDVGTVDRMQKAEQELISGIVSSKNLSNKQKCVFLDRDGTINQYNGLISKDEDLILEDFSVDAIKHINESGYLAIVITNQPVVARGLCSIIEVENINNKMKTILGEKGAYLDDVLYCPHHPDKGYPEENPEYKIKCTCRKPNTGLIQKCIEKYNIDVTQSYFIGDTTVDIQTGKNAGMKTVLVQTGEAGKDNKYIVEADWIADNLYEAVRKIINT